MPEFKVGDRVMWGQPGRRLVEAQDGRGGRSPAWRDFVPRRRSDRFDAPTERVDARRHHLERGSASRRRLEPRRHRPVEEILRARRGLAAKYNLSKVAGAVESASTSKHRTTSPTSRWREWVEFQANWNSSMNGALADRLGDMEAVSRPVIHRQPQAPPAAQAERTAP